MSHEYSILSSHSYVVQEDTSLKVLFITDYETDEIWARPNGSDIYDWRTQHLTLDTDVRTQVNIKIVGKQFNL